jgi:phospholipid-binding lipoprotein MlaA
MRCARIRRGTLVVLLLAGSLLLGGPGWAENAAAPGLSSPEGAGAASEGPAAPDRIPDPLFDDDFDDFDPAPEVFDPLEPANRAVFGFNQRLDRYFWSPMTRVYRTVAPDPVRRGIHRAMLNLNTPIYVVNNVLQLRIKDAGETIGAFVLNSTIGMLGFLEPSKEAGWEAQPADFGQTLGLVGVPEGPYLVIPVLGPSTVRDGFGMVVDRLAHPLTYVLPLASQLIWGGSYGLSMRDEVSEKIDALEASSVDFYAVMRSAYLQSRRPRDDVAALD